MGIDIETIIDDGAADSIAQHVASASEIARLSALANQRAPCPLTLLFSAKESFFKAAYRQVGKYFEFDTAGARMLFRCVKPLSPALRENTRFDASYAQLHDATVLTAVLLR